MKAKVLILSAAILLTAVCAGCSGSNTRSGSEPKTESKESTASSVESAPSSEESSKESVSSEEASQPAGTPVDQSWFDDAVFIGDSVTLKLSYYCEDHDDLGKAEFLCAGSLGYTNALWELDHEDNVHPTYNGEKVTVDEGAKMLGSKKIFIMLGMNDIGLYGIDGAASSMIELTDKIAEKCPDATIYIQSVTPMVAGNSLGDLNNENIYLFDDKLKEICKEKGYQYLDVASAVSNEDGSLIYEYCGDPPTDDNPDAMGLHFTDVGCQKWAEYLRNHVQ